MSSLPRRSSVLPWDIELLSGLVLLTMLLEGVFFWAVLPFGFLLFGGGRFGVAELWILVGAGRCLVTLLAAYRLRAMHAWARWWLLLDAMVSVAVFALYPRALVSAETDLFDVYGWVRTFVISPVTLLVLGRPQRRFHSLNVRELSLVCAGIGLVAVFPYRIAGNRAWSEAIQHGTYVRSLGTNETVMLRPMLLGRPMTEIPADRVSVTLRTCIVIDGQLQSGPSSGEVLELPWHVRGDAIEISKVPPAIYNATIIVRRPTDAPAAAPGELRGSVTHSFKIGSGPVRLDVRMEEVMRLTRPPVDTEFPIVTSPVEVAWQPVHGAASYAVALLPDDDYRVKDDGEIETVTSEPGVRVELSPGGWAIELAAIDHEDRILGRLSTGRIFEVVDALAPEPVRPANCPEWLPIPLCYQVALPYRTHVEPEPVLP